MRNKISNFRRENKLIFILVVLLLIFLNIFLFMQVFQVFNPIRQALHIVFPPLVASVIAFYVLNPFVDYFQKRNVPRLVSILLVFIFITILIILGVLFIVPIINDQITAIIEVVPLYWQEGLHFFEDRVGSERLPEIIETVQQTDFLQTATSQAQNILYAAVGGIGSVINVTTQIVITVFTVPFVLYFLLVDSSKIPHRLIMLTPIKFRPSMRRFLSNVNQQLGIYVRGQLFVALCVSIIFLIGYSAIGLDFYLVLAIIAGLFNLVPFLGSFISGCLAVIVATFQDPILLLYLLIVFAIEQILENRVIQPLVLGSQLNIHPITILFVILISGSSFGVVGLLLGVPTYAILKIIFSMLFEYIEETTDLYDENTVDDPEEAVLKSQD